MSHDGEHFTVENARLSTLRDTPPPIAVAAGGVTAADVAGRIGDALFDCSADAQTFEGFRAAGGDGKPRCLQ